MKKATILITSLVLVFPLSSQAGKVCSPDGFTVLTINGVFVDERGAQINKERLEKNLGDEYGNQKLYIDYLHNPSHIGGAGDILKAVYQKYWGDDAVNDYDLREMIKAASEKVTTQKLLLVAHSQGNFYDNSFYVVVAVKSWLVPTKSIGVYSVATPADRVAGGGKWLTSSTDEVIAGLVSRAPFRKILSPNTHILLPTSDVTLGHSFSDVYLKYRGAEVVTDIQTMLDNLRPNIEQNDGCIDPPRLGIGHAIIGMAFAVADPVANVSRTVASSAVSGLHRTGVLVAETGAHITNGIWSIGNFVGRSASQVIGIINNSGSERSTTLLSNVSSSNSDTSTPSNGSVRIGQEANVSDTFQETIETEDEAGAFDTQVGVVDNPPANEVEITQSPIVQPVAIVPPPLPTFPSAPAIIVPGFGGGAPSVIVEVTESETQGEEPEEQVSEEPEEPQDTTPPNAPIITYPTEGAVLTTSDVRILGNAEGGVTVFYENSASTTTTTDGIWELPLTFIDGEHTVTLTAVDAAGNTSASSSVSFSIDTAAPDFTAEIEQCEQSFSPDTCLLVVGDLSVIATSTTADIDYFMFEHGGVVATSSGSFLISQNQEGAVTVEVVAIDTAGNSSATTTLSAVLVENLVVINEVSWMGTQASTADEWVELYNNTAYELDLSDFTFYAADLSPYVSLSGTIAPYGYYLIERKNSGEVEESAESSVVDIVAGAWETFGSGLNNSGEELYLTRQGVMGTTTIDYVPLCNNQWCGGSNISSSRRFTMERYSPSSSGGNSSSWGTAVGEWIINGTDASGFPVKGTPGSRNSINYLVNIPQGTSEFVLSKANSPYYIPQFGISVGEETTLSIEPGVVIKFNPLRNAKIAVYGSIEAQGTEEEPIVFTSIFDDEYGGDINNGTCIRNPCPGSGDWNQIVIESSKPSHFSHVLLRYGGFVRNGTPISGTIGVGNGEVYLDNVRIEFSRDEGLFLYNAIGEITDSTFVDIGKNGIKSEFSTTTIRMSHFENNGQYGISISGSPGYLLEDNTFLNNTSGETSIANSVDLSQSE